MKKASDIIRFLGFIATKSLFVVLTKILFATKVEGKENLPKNGPFIIAANHASLADAPVIGLSVPFIIRWIALQDVYNAWYFKPLHKIFNTIAINGSIKKALEALEQKDVVGIFPGGTRSFDGKLRRGKVGVAIMALKSGAPVVPVGVSGTFKAFPRQAAFPRFHPVLVKIGKPQVFHRYDKDVIEEDVLRKTTDQIIAGIGRLLVDI